MKLATRRRLRRVWRRYYVASAAMILAGATIAAIFLLITEGKIT